MTTNANIERALWAAADRLWADRLNGQVDNQPVTRGARLVALYAHADQRAHDFARQRCFCYYHGQYLFNTLTETTHP